MDGMKDDTDRLTHLGAAPVSKANPTASATSANETGYITPSVAVGTPSPKRGIPLN